jgi:hypothetical protein
MSTSPSFLILYLYLILLSKKEKINNYMRGTRPVGLTPNSGEKIGEGVVHSSTLYLIIF